MLSRVGWFAVTMLFLTSSAGLGVADELKVGGTGAAAGLLERLAEAFRKTQPDDAVEVVPGLGSSGGISALAEGALQLSVSGRALKAEETVKGVESRPLLDTPFLFVTSHPKPQSLSRADIVAVHDGSLKAWPDGKEIRPILRPKSDAAAAFVTASFEGMPAAMETLRQRPDVLVAATDQDNLEAARRVPNSLAGMTLLQFTTEDARLRPIRLDGVEASLEGMATGAYPLKMRLHLVTRADPPPAVQRFVRFVGSPEAQAIMRASGAAPVAPPGTGTQ